MDTPLKTVPQGYKDSFGKSIDNDVEKWFRFGIKPVGEEQHTGLCSKKVTYYFLFTGIFIVVLLIVIIVPVIAGKAQQNGK